MCYEVEDIVEAMKMVSSRGLDLIDNQPRTGAEGQIVFIHPKSTNGALTEMVQVPQTKS